MTLLGNLIKQGIRIRESLDQDFTPPFELQKTEFRKLIISARNTQVGKASYLLSLIYFFLYRFDF